MAEFEKSRICGTFVYMTMYYIANILPEDLNWLILQYKEMMYDRYQCKIGLKSPAHITFIPPFYMDEAFEEKLIIDLNNFSQHCFSFTVSTNGFSAFQTKTIFIDVSVNKELKLLKEEMDQYFRKINEYPMKFDDRPYHPHITIATRDLSKKIFFEIFPHFQKQSFDKKWSVNSVSLLRHNQKKWDVIHTSHFKVIS